MSLSSQSMTPLCKFDINPQTKPSQAIPDKTTVSYMVSISLTNVPLPLPSMKAWAQTLDPSSKSGIRFLADPHAKFTNALDLAFDGTAIFGQPRSKRYALVIEDGKVKSAHVEEDNTGMSGK